MAVDAAEILTHNKRQRASDGLDLETNSIRFAKESLIAHTQRRY